MPDPTPDSNPADDSFDRTSALENSELVSEDATEDEGPGCFPGVLAATLVMGMLFFISCAFLAWLIYGKRTELALRTLEYSYVQLIEQSRLSPDDKADLLEEIDELATKLKSGEYEDWQAAGALTRLSRLPITRWGDLQAVETFAATQGDELAESATLHLSRMRRGVELGELTTYDIEDALKPVTVTDDAAMSRSLTDNLRVKDVREVVLRAKLLADRSKIPEKVYSDVRIRTIVRREIEAGLAEGTY